MNEGIEPVFLAQRYALLFIIGATGLSVRSQPSCSIDLGPDVMLGVGSLQLNGPAGFSNYLWNTSAATANITVNTPGVYSCQVSYNTGSLVTNGNFVSGNTGFSTQFNYSSTLTTEGNYYVGTNAATYHPQFSGTGTGNFLIVNSGWPSANFNVWCQSITVCPEQTYTMSYWVQTISNAQPARLQWWVDGSWTGPEVTLPNFGYWQQITHTWTSAAGQTSANFCLRVMSGDGVGNDFAIDDISISSTVVLSDEVEVLASTLPIELLSFRGEAIMGQNHLNWSTASERNNDYFRLLRSVDIEMWEEITRIPGAGNSQTVLDYHAVDDTPLVGTTYYTLVQVDMDGTEARSPVVAVAQVGNELYLTGPNPAPVGMPIQINGTLDGLRVTDLIGRHIAHTVNNNSLSILGGAGVYVVTMQRGATVRSVRVIME
ncbi:MAG TPA: hypothetical protein PLE78_01035 [Flavobacteriales bacterium]|nr:hypothetical protein [Flavobacteriales bacterium]